AAPPPLPPRPKASVPPVDETSPAASAPPEAIGGVPVLASIGPVTLAHPESPEAPEGALAVSAPSLAPAPADVSPQDAPGSPSEPVTEAAPGLPRAPPGGSPNDFPFLSPALASAGSSTAELEAVDRAAALGSRGRRVWPWTLLLAIVAVGGAGAAWFFIKQQPPSTGRVVLELSPPEARGRVPLSVDGADLGVPSHWPVVQNVRSGEAENPPSAGGLETSAVG